jgi:protocatechuate 3,4-dioxygenase beta subunit
MRLCNLLTATCAVIGLAISISAQAPAPEGTATISGRVTLNGQPYSNAQVLLTPQPKDNDNIIQRITGSGAAQKTSTDADGHYSFVNLPAGPYEIQVFAPALVGTGHDEPILAADGETIDGIDFTMTAGGVITGSVLQANGRPAINKSIRVELANEKGPTSETAAATLRAMMKQILSRNTNTDDRGVYRIYGVPSGDYTVSVNSGGGRHESVATYYPGVTDKTKATTVKVRAGAESTGIDFKLDLSKKGYEVRGRVVDEHGNGVQGVMIIVSSAPEQGAGAVFGGLSGQGHSNSKGEFKVEGMQPGKYTAAVFSMFDDANIYSDTATFEITSSDATAVEIKTHKGLTASGVLVLEGNDDPAVAAQLPQVQLMAAVTSTDSSPGFGMGTVSVAPDSTFTVNGLRPGKFMIMTSPMAQDSRFSVMRIERGGVAQNAGIDISLDNPVTDIKVVVGYRNCAIFGRATVSGGSVPKGSGVNVSVKRVATDANESTSSHFAVGVDGIAAMGLGSGTSREFTVSPGGDFRADLLIPGDYEVTARFMDKPGTKDADLKTVTQKVTLTSGSQIEVSLVLDLSPNK